METTISIPSNFQPISLRKHGCKVIVSSWDKDYIQIGYNYHKVDVEWTKIDNVVTIKMYSGLITWLTGQGIVHIYVPNNVDICYF